MPSLWMIKAKINVLFQQKRAHLQQRFRRDSWEGHKGFELSPRKERFDERRGIKWLPLLPAVLALVALTLAFLCVLAGSREGYMDDYAILTLNTSSIGLDIVKPPAHSIPTSPEAANPLSSIINPLLSTSQTILNELTTFFAKKAGLQDFYSVHMLNYCYGASTTISPAPIKTVSGCSTSTVLFAFDPMPILQNALDQADINLAVGQLNWPQALQDGITQLKMMAHVALATYIISIVFSFFTIFACVYWMSGYSTGSRRIVAASLCLAGTASAALVGASVTVTVMMERGRWLVDEYGSPVGVSVVRGDKFLALTWCAALMAFGAVVAVGGECCKSRNREAIRMFFEK
ncbi:hypothetical protein FKW77_009342 [Venturia effusa]|uniref:Integral membrane protein n=1 Tax=Venturia effusa TaxID=50376 RepID=A0A517L824_9PEZI|nr:hypothetical protein FKW77_009342 [Venturia effusa]